MNKLPDLVDHCVTKGIPQDFADVWSCFDLSSHHSPILVTLSSQVLRREPPPSLCNRRTNWDEFRNLITERLTLHISLITAEDIEAAVQYFNDNPKGRLEHNAQTNKTNECPLLIKQKILDKRRLHRRWNQLGTPGNKLLLNTATRELKQLLNNNRNDNIQTFLQDLTPTASIKYSLWKAIKMTKQITESSPPLWMAQGTWARSDFEKANIFAEHLSNVFQPHPSENSPVEEEVLTQSLDTPYQLDPPLKHLLRSEVHAVVKKHSPKKSSSYELITAKILQELPVVGIQYPTQLFNAAMLTGHFPAQWKVAQMICATHPETR
jgi:hypothetical protein